MYPNSCELSVARVILLFILFAIVSVLPERLPAQEIRDTKGREFWVAIPPTDHSEDANGDFVLSFVSESQTIVRVEATTREGATFTRVFPLDSGEMLTTRYQTSDYELIGYDAILGIHHDDEKIMPCSFRISSDNEITVYALQRTDKTSDAWIVLPTDVLGTNYFIMSYRSFAKKEELFGREFITEAYPSQFTIIASEDNTTIVLNLSVTQTTRTTGNSRKVILNKGDVYLVQALVTKQDVNDDLTGSRVISDKPIAIVSGHFRAQVPIISDVASRDLLAEQLPSIETWGKQIIIPPLTPPNITAILNQNDVPQCRILASEDATLVTINNGAPFTLNSAEFRDVQLTRALVVNATKPILCAALDRSSKHDNQSATLHGDPSMIIQPPTEQYLTNYVVINSEPRTQGIPLFSEHYISIVVPMEAASTLTIDNQRVQNIQPIPGTTFGYSSTKVSAGAHSAECQLPFGITIYGYGPAESYGYTGGMAFERLYVPTIYLRTLSVKAKPGDAVNLIAVVDSISDYISFQSYLPQTLSSVITINSTVFVPATTIPFTKTTTSSIQIPFTKDISSLRMGDTLAVIPGTAVLGSVLTDSIEIGKTNITWNISTIPLHRISTVSGVLEIDGICVENGTRLFTPFPQQKMLPREIYVCDIRGKVVGTLDNAYTLPNGLYITSTGAKIMIVNGTITR